MRLAEFLNYLRRQGINVTGSGPYVCHNPANGNRASFHAPHGGNFDNNVIRHVCRDLGIATPV